MSTAKKKNDKQPLSGKPSAPEKSNEATDGPLFLCVHCDHRFAHDGEAPTRCPSCMRKGGLEKLKEAVPASSTWLMPVMVLGCVIAVGVGYSLWERQAADIVDGEPAMVPLERSELRGYLVAAGADGDQIDALSGGENVSLLAAHATGGSAEAKIASLMGFIGDRRAAGAFVRLPLDTPRETLVHHADWSATQILDDERAALYPLEVALAAVAALREVDVPAMVAEIWQIEGARRPPDPSGQMGYFGVALLDDALSDDGEGSFYDPYGGGVPSEDGVRVLSDVQAVAAFMSLRGLSRLVHENDGIRALSDAQHALALDERSPYIRTVRGTILTQSGGIEEGIREMEAASNIRSDAPRRNNLAGLFIAMGRMEDADSSVAAALEEQPDFAFAHANLAVIHLSGGAIEEARRELSRAQELEPSLHVLPLLWAQLYLSDHDTAQAVHWAQIAVERRPRNVQAHLAAAQIYGAAGQPNDMRREVQAMLALIPENRREAYRQEVSSRLGRSALEEPEEELFDDEEFADDFDDEGLEPAGADYNLGSPSGFGTGSEGGPSLLDGELEGGFQLGGGGGGLLGGGGGGGGGFRLRLND